MSVYANIYEPFAEPTTVDCGNAFPFHAEARLPASADGALAEVWMNGSEFVGHYSRQGGKWLDLATEWPSIREAMGFCTPQTIRTEVIKAEDDFWLKCWECLYALQTNGDQIELLRYAYRLPHNPSPEQIQEALERHREKCHAG